MSRQILRDREKCVWAAVDPTTGEHYVALFNLTQKPMPVGVSLQASMEQFPGTNFGAGEYEEVWSGDRIQGTEIHGEVAPHGALLYHTI